MSFLRWLANSDVVNGVVIFVFFGVFCISHSTLAKREPSGKWLIVYFLVAFVAMILLYRFVINPALRS